MRHKKSFNHLSRKTAHRKAMLANMAASLILHKKISTTTAKAKALRMYVEPLITKAKDDSTHSRRIVFSYLQDKDAVAELFREVGAKVTNRPGGYTRILKTGNRLGDNADMCIIELVDYNENLLAAKSEKQEKSTTRRSRRGGKKSTTAQTAPKAEPKVEAEGEVKAEEKVAEKVKSEIETLETEKADTTPMAAEEEKKAEAKEDEKEEPKAKKAEPKKEEPKKEEKKVEAKKDDKKEAGEEKKEDKKDDKKEE